MKHLTSPYMLHPTASHWPWPQRREDELMITHHDDNRLLRPDDRRPISLLLNKWWFCFNKINYTNFNLVHEWLTPTSHLVSNWLNVLPRLSLFASCRFPCQLLRQQTVTLKTFRAEQTALATGMCRGPKGKVYFVIRLPPDPKSVYILLLFTSLSSPFTLIFTTK